MLSFRSSSSPLLTVIIHNLYIVSAVLFEDEADPVPYVDPYRVLPFAITLQSFEPVARRRAWYRLAAASDEDIFCGQGEATHDGRSGGHAAAHRGGGAVEARLGVGVDLDRLGSEVHDPDLPDARAGV